jgi:hypothetical protein
LKRISSTTTIEDLQANPQAYGLPTYQQFLKNRDLYLGRSDEQMIALSEGPQIGRKDLNKIKFQLHGVDLPNEESVEKALADHGYTLDEIDLEKRDGRLKKSINMIPLGGGKFDILVNFQP